MSKVSLSSSSVLSASSLFTQFSISKSGVDLGSDRAHDEIVHPIFGPQCCPKG